MFTAALTGADALGLVLNEAAPVWLHDGAELWVQPDGEGRGRRSAATYVALLERMGTAAPNAGIWGIGNWALACALYYGLTNSTSYVGLFTEEERYMSRAGAVVGGPAEVGHGARGRQQGLPGFVDPGALDQGAQSSALEGGA